MKEPATRRKARRTHGVPAIRGTLKIYRHGELVEEIPATRADLEARKTVRGTQGKGKLGRDW